MLFERFVNETIVRFREGTHPKLRMESSAHVKRPMNCFMVWSREKRYHILKEHPGINNAEVSKALGAAWRKLSEEDKEPYVEEARRLTEQHKMDNPGYKYQPKRRKPKRKRKTDKKIVPSTTSLKQIDPRKSSSEKTHFPFKMWSESHTSLLDDVGGRPSVLLPPHLSVSCLPPTFQKGTTHEWCLCHNLFPAPHCYLPWAGGMSEHFYNVESTSCFRIFNLQGKPLIRHRADSIFNPYKM